MKVAQAKASAGPTAAKNKVVPLGINLEVIGTALISQARDRIQWHKRIAADQAEVLKQIPPDNPREPQFMDSWKRQERRRELTECIRAHEEYARFLEFVRRHLKPRQIYRLSLQDLSNLEIAPKGRYF